MVVDRGCPRFHLFAIFPSTLCDWCTFVLDQTLQFSNSLPENPDLVQLSKTFLHRAPSSCKNHKTTVIDTYRKMEFPRATTRHFRISYDWGPTVRNPFRTSTSPPSRAPWPRPKIPHWNGPDCREICNHWLRRLEPMPDLELVESYV